MADKFNNDNVFFQDGYKLAKEHLSGNFRKEELFDVLRTLHQSIDLLIDSLLAMARKQGIHVACSKGCEWCCHQAVFANSYEIHYLSEFIKSRFSVEETQLFYDLARRKDEDVKKLSEQKLLQYKSPCPLLVNGACSAYEARPMACRIYLSTNLKSCLEYFSHPENEDNYPALLDFPLNAGKMMNEGLMAALLEKEIQTAEFRLEEGLTINLHPNFSSPDNFSEADSIRK